MNAAPLRFDMATKPRRSRSTEQVKGVDEPADGSLRLPHERDESSSQPPTPRARVMKRAHRDVSRGQVDTDDRGIKAGRAFDNAYGSKARTATVQAVKRKRSRP